MTLDRLVPHRFTSTDGLFCDRCQLPKGNHRHLQGGAIMSIASLEVYIPGAGKITVEHFTITSEGRAQFRYWIEQSGNVLVDGDSDLSLGVGRPASHVEAMASLLSFLGAAAESYGHSMRHRVDLSETENGTIFSAEVTEWAYQNSDELAMAAVEMEGQP